MADETSVTREIGNVLDHWEQLPNDLRFDPGFDALNKALEKLHRAVIYGRRVEEPKCKG